MPRGFLPLLYLALPVWLSLSGVGQAADKSPPSYQKSHTKGLTTPFYHGDPPKLGAMVKVERVFTDYAKKGFLRIGLFPFLVAEGVVIDVRDPSLVEETLVSLKKWSEAGGKGKLAELRRVKFTFPKSLDRELQANKVKLGDSGQWSLEGDVSIRIGAKTFRASSAQLTVAGKDTGLVTWTEDGKERTLKMLAKEESPPAASQPP